MKTVCIASKDKILFDFLSALFEENGYTVSDGAPFTLVDLDTCAPPKSGEYLTLSKDPFSPCDLPRPFSVENLLSLCRLRMGEGEGDLPALEEVLEEAPDLILLEDGVSVAGETVFLRGGEYRLFKCLFDKRGEVVTFEEAADALGGLAAKGNGPSVYINHLRKKLDYRFGKRMIVTVRQKGFCLL